MSNLKFKINTASGEAGVTDLEHIVLHDTPMAGCYAVKWRANMFGGSEPYMVQETFSVPTTYKSVTSQIVDFEEIESLLGDKKKRICQALGVNNKIGYLLHGKQGSGKTTALLSIAKYFIEEWGAMTFIVQSEADVKFVSEYIARCNKITPIIPVIIHDECEYWMAEYETFFKDFLDGHNTPNNLIYLAATNYIKNIPNTIAKRPSRFKHVTKYDGFTGKEVILEVLSSMNDTLTDADKLSASVLIEMSEQIPVATADQLKHVFIDTVMKGEICLMQEEVVEEPISKKIDTSSPEYITQLIERSYPVKFSARKS